MKIKLTLAALAAIGTIASAQATEINPELKKLTEIKTEKPKVRQNEKADFGIYKLQPDLVLVPSSLAGDTATGTLNGRAVVKQVGINADGKVKADSVVRNLLTGETGVVTGRISVLAKDQASIEELRQQFGLKLVKSVSEKIAIVQAPTNADLTALMKLIRESGLVKEVRLDVIEKLNKPN